MKKLIVPISLALLAGCGQINSDEAGFKTSFGRIDTPVLEPGLYGVNPFGGKLWKYSLRDIRTDVRMAAYTKDMQSADFQISVIHAIDRMRLTDLHVKYGERYAAVILEPVVAAAVKDTIGQWEADKLVNGREEATKAIYQKVLSLAKDAPLLVKGLVISNIDYSDAFEKAIEAKVVAQQEAIKARNRTVQVEEEARQKVITAEAEVRAMQIKGDALKANQGLVLLEAVQKWNGTPPQTLCVGSDVKTMLPVR